MTEFLVSYPFVMIMYVGHILAQKRLPQRFYEAVSISKSYLRTPMSIVKGLFAVNKLIGLLGGI